MYTGNQTTILNEISFFFFFLNKEKVVNVKIIPANIDDGIIFKRVDLTEGNIIKLNYKNSYIENDKLIIKNEENIFVDNVELLIAALWAAKIDNAVIELDGESIPYIDGTTEPLSFLLTIGKTRELDKTRNIFELNNEICVKFNQSSISAKPSKSFIIDINDENGNFVFDNNILPYKDYLSFFNEESKDVSRYHTIMIIALIFISNSYCLFEINATNFDKKTVFEFFKNLFVNAGRSI